MKDDPAVGPVRAICASVVPTIFVVMPTLLVGTMAVRLRREWGFGEAALGLAIASSRATSALGSAPLGRLAERLGAVAGLRLGSAIGAVSLLGIGAIAGSWVALVSFLAVAGLATAIVRPSGDLLLTQTIARDRQGLAFGIQQAVPPAAAMLAGLAVPALALTLGWRSVFLVAGAGTVLAVLVVPGAAIQDQRGLSVDRRGDVSLKPMVTLAVGQAFGAAGATCLTAFLVTSAVAAGIPERTAALLFAFGASIGVLSRVGFGHRADRRPRRQLVKVSMMLIGGAAAYLLIATGRPGILLIGVPLAFATAYGWTGLFTLAVVRANPNAPAAGTGITRTGGFIGGVIGPIVFGLAAQESYALAWVLTAGWSIAGGITIALGRRQVVAELRSRGGSVTATSR